MRTTTFFAASFFCALAVGCSSSDAKNGASPDGGPAVNPDGGVAGLDIPIPDGIWTKATNIEHYKIYATRDDAIAWFQGAKARNATISSDNPVASSDPRYATVDADVADIWKGFQAVFARDTEDVPTPIVVLTDPASNAPGAYAVYDDELGASPNVFMIQTPTLPLGDVALRGVIAHELTHHVLKHKWPGVEDKIEKWYDPTKALKSGFGFDQTNDDAVSTPGLNYVGLANSTGDYPATQWNGFDRPDSAIEVYRTLIHTQAAAKNAGPCTTSDTARNALLTFVDPLRDRATNILNATPAQLTQLDTMTKGYVAEETTCASAVTDTFFTVVANATQTTEADIRAGASADAIAANDGATNAYDAIVRLTKNYDAQLLAIPVTNLRHYTFEEQADDMSQVVLFMLKEDYHGIITYLQTGALNDAQGQLSAAASAECTSFGTNEPPYGILTDPHHSTCWRIWHSTKLAAGLASH